MQKNRRRHYRVTLGDAIGAHERAIREFGGRPGIHDLNLIESAIARPYTGYYRAITRKAAALVQSVACNHGFLDGNKRTAFYLMTVLLLKSGYYLRTRSKSRLNDDIEKMILDVVNHHLDFDGIVDWFKTRIAKR